MSRTLPITNQEDDTSDDTVLGATVGAFAHRLQQQLKAKEIKDSQSEKAREERHALMMQAMTTIRKALQETCKINLGNRFQFAVEVSDWEGWPRIELNLVDNFAIERKDYGLIVTANDRKDLGTIQMSTRSLMVLGKVQLCDAREFARLPLVLKRAVRQFLDMLGPYLLNPTTPDAPIKSAALEEREKDVVDDKLSKENQFFQEEGQNYDNVISGDTKIQPIDM